MPALSNGNSFNGSSASRSLEPWFTSALLRAIQDRGDI